MGTSLDSVVNVLRRSGLVDESVVTEALSKIESGLLPATGEALLESLIAQKSVTLWQAQKIVQGKHKGFFLGKYKLLRLLGKGGMSSVYLAEHVLMRRHCAIKVLPWKLVKDSSYLQRFHREAQAVASLDHPNIVRAYDIDHETEGTVEIHFLVMEYVEGQNLFDFVQQNGILSPTMAADYTRQGALGLAHAHKIGMVHRDVKPGNFIVDQHGTVKLMDLGLARVDEKEDNSLTMVHDEKVLGTADYLAPEQAVDSHKVDTRADLYSLGCTLYYFLSGHPPFNEGNITQRLLAHQTKEPKPISTIRSDVPESLLKILRRLMMKDPAQRYQTAEEVIQDLEQWLQGKAPPENLMAIAEPPVETLDLDDGSVVVQASSPKHTTKLKSSQTDNALGSFLSNLSDLQAEPTETADSAVEKKPTPTTTELAREMRDISAGPASKTASVKTGNAPTPTPSKPETKTAETRKPEPTKAAPPQAKQARPTPPQPAEAEILPGDDDDLQILPMDLEDSNPFAAPRSSQTSPAKAGTTRKPAPTPVAKPAARKTKTASKSLPDQIAGLGEKLPAPIGPFVQKNPIPAVAAAGVGLLLTLGGIGYALTGSGGTKTPSTAGPVAVVQTEQPAATAPPVVTPKKEMRKIDGATVLVGADGHFETIAEALKHVRQAGSSLGGVREIQLEAGELFAESIHIDNGGLGGFPSGVKIVGLGSPPPVVKPIGSLPTLKLNSVEGLTIENVAFDCSGRANGVELEGFMSGTTLRNCRFDDLQSRGISALGIAGIPGVVITIENCTFKSENPAAVGIYLDASTGSDAREIAIRGNRFLGPLAAGVRFEGTGSNVVLQSNIFNHCESGIQFAGAEQHSQKIQLRNNTFNKGSEGIVFTTGPATDSTAFLIENNLFVGQTGASLSFARDGATVAAISKGSAVRFNWTENTEAPAEAVNLFKQNGVTGKPVAFASEDPLATDFLKPTTAEVASPNAPGNLKYFGAVAP